MIVIKGETIGGITISVNDEESDLDADVPPVIIEITSEVVY